VARREIWFAWDFFLGLSLAERIEGIERKHTNSQTETRESKAVSVYERDLVEMVTANSGCDAMKV